MMSWLKGLGAKKDRKPEDPMEAWDRRIDALSGKGSELRKAAATLLALRSELERGVNTAKARMKDAGSRLEQAIAQSKQDVATVLEDDLEQARERADHLTAELERVVQDASALGLTAREIEKEAEGLRRERASAAARLMASKTVSGLAHALNDRLDEVMALEKARDDIERAHALAEICKEDLEERKKRGG